MSVSVFVRLNKFEMLRRRISKVISRVQQLKIFMNQVYHQPQLPQLLPLQLKLNVLIFGSWINARRRKTRENVIQQRLVRTAKRLVVFVDVLIFWKPNNAKKWRKRTNVAKQMLLSYARKLVDFARMPISKWEEALFEEK